MNRSNVLKLALAAIALSAIVAAQRNGAFDALDTERLEATFRELGIWGPVLYVVLFAMLEAFFVPGIVFVVPGGMVWDWPTLFVLSLLGATGAAAVGFGFAHTIGRRFVEQRLSVRTRAYDLAIARNGLRTVILLRLIFFIAPWANWLFGISSVRFRDFIVGTVIGFTPMMLAFTWFGADGLGFFFDEPVLGTAILAAFLAAMFLTGRSFHRRILAEVEAEETARARCSRSIGSSEA